MKNLTYVPVAVIWVWLAACCGAAANAADAPGATIGSPNRALGTAGQASSGTLREPAALIPQPRSIQPLAGRFILDEKTAIVVDKNSAGGMSIGKQLAERIRRGTGLDLPVSCAAVETNIGPLPGTIRITTRAASAMGSARAAGTTALAKPVPPMLAKPVAPMLAKPVAPERPGSEGYVLEVVPDGVRITGSDAAGMFYGTQTLLQLLPPQVFGRSKAQGPIQWTIPAVSIHDRPRFHWRGLLLDVARHFFTKEEVKNFLDLMAEHKLNTLQLHLTDDQGWRVEIKRYPKLTEEAAWRKSIGFGLNAKDSTAYRADGRYGGFYTQEDVRELVAYARARYITIVPEIEMPGHSGGALSAYPELSCFGGPYNRDGGGMGIYCPGNDRAFDFLQDVLAEVIDLFPGTYIHIGGDEVGKQQWKRCPKCQARIKQEGLKDEHELQSYFVRRIERFINSRGRTLIGWDEILEGGLAPKATVMSWRSIESAVVAAEAGHDVVMTPTSNCYFDYCQAKTGEPRAIGGFLPLQPVYGFDPMPAKISPEKAHHILGAGGTLWSEFFPNYAHVQYMTYPRACAMAEVTWTDPQRKNWDDFKRRLEVHLQRLKAQGVRYRPPSGDDPGYDVR